MLFLIFILFYLQVEPVYLRVSNKCSHFTFDAVYIFNSIGGKRIKNMLYADELCIVSLYSAGLQQLLSICDQYCAMHSITFKI